MQNAIETIAGSNGNVAIRQILQMIRIYKAQFLSEHSPEIRVLQFRYKFKLVVNLFPIKKCTLQEGFWDTVHNYVARVRFEIDEQSTEDCETMLLNQKIYYLNKSKSKWISVGLYYPFEFASVVKIFGRSKQYVIFKEEEWIQFHEQRENINKYFQTFDTMWKPRQIGSKTLTFEMIEEKKNLKIEDISRESVESLVIRIVLSFRLSYSSGSNFKHFYEDVIRAVVKTCSQCLVKRISEIELRHFFETINKYIKDCSDSNTSSSSDEEEYKAVEQNGEDPKTTEEE
ncbi:hypothetical protein FQA39_LY18510 [Lamprigera yunnana]|nr:hypothetical protein FQA39_LY18510 [Lamprigera yunnana]